MFHEQFVHHLTAGASSYVHTINLNPLVFQLEVDIVEGFFQVFKVAFYLFLALLYLQRTGRILTWKAFLQLLKEIPPGPLPPGWPNVPLFF